MRSWQFLLSPSGQTKNADLNENGVPPNALYYLNEQCLFTPLFKAPQKDLVRGNP